MIIDSAAAYDLPEDSQEQSQAYSTDGNIERGKYWEREILREENIEIGDIEIEGVRYLKKITSNTSKQK